MSSPTVIANSGSSNVYLDGGIVTARRLAHELMYKTGSKVARAYNRTDYLDQRRPYLERWADFLDQGYKNVCG